MLPTRENLVLRWILMCEDACESLGIPVKFEEYHQVGRLRFTGRYIWPRVIATSTTYRYSKIFISRWDKNRHLSVGTIVATATCHGKRSIDYVYGIVEVPRIC